MGERRRETRGAPPVSLLGTDIRASVEACVLKHGVTQQQPGRTGLRLLVQPKDHLAANGDDSLI